VVDTGYLQKSHPRPVFFWLGFWFWLGHLGAALDRFFASLMAVVGTIHQVGWSGEARGSHGGATGGAALTFPPGGCAGRIFFRAAPLEISG
jgi:hypothetical protein